MVICQKLLKNFAESPIVEVQQLLCLVMVTGHYSNGCYSEKFSSGQGHSQKFVLGRYKKFNNRSDVIVTP